MERTSGRHGFLRWFTLLALVVATLIPALGATAVSAQGEAQTFTSPLTGQVIQTSGSWVIDTASVDSSPELELILLYGEFDGMMVAYLPAGTDLDMARDLFLEEFSTVFDNFVDIDRGAYGNVSYSLDIASTEGVEFGVFSLFLGQRASGFVEYYLYFGPVMFFQQGMASAQANVTVGGAPVFDGVDPAGLQDLLNANAGATGASTEAPAGNLVQEEAQEEPAAPTEAPPADSGEATGAGAAYIEQIQGELEYVASTLTDFLENFGSLQGDNAAGAVEEINRIASEWEGYPDRAAAITPPAGFEDVHADYLAFAESVEQLSVAWYGVVDAIQNSGDVDGALTSFTQVMGEVQTQSVDISNQLAEAGGGATEPPAQEPTEAPVPTPTAEPETPSTPEQAEAEDEEVVDLTEDQPESEEAVNESETGQGGGPVDVSEFEDLGLVADDMWVSPQFDVEVTWDESWFFNPDDPEGIVSDTSSGRDAITLVYASPAGDNAIGVLFVDVVEAGGVTPEDLGGLWSSGDYLQENEAELVLSDANRRGTSAAVISREFLDDGTELLVLREAACADDACEVIVMATLFAEASSFSSVYDAARGGVEADGSRLVSVFTVREVEEAGE